MSDLAALGPHSWRRFARGLTFRHWEMFKGRQRGRRRKREAFELLRVIIW